MGTNPPLIWLLPSVVIGVASVILWYRRPAWLKERIKDLSAPAWSNITGCLAVSSQMIVTAVQRDGMERLVLLASALVLMPLAAVFHHRYLMRNRK